jgi:hypothetical protein
VSVCASTPPTTTVSWCFIRFGQAARFALRSLARRVGLLDEQIAALDRQLDRSFAALCGASPIPSGKTTRQRLNPGGDRDANRALHLIAVCRLRYCPRTRAHARRRAGESESKAEILRASSATSHARPTTR